MNFIADSILLNTALRGNAYKPDAPVAGPVPTPEVLAAIFAARRLRH